MATNKHKPLPTLTEKELHRLWSKIEARGPDECWPWTGRRDKNGYGIFIQYPNYKELRWRVARLVVFLKTGIDPGDNEVAHSCDNPPCSNWAHLHPKTHTDNMKEIKTKGREARGARHGSVTKPDRIARGERHGSRTHPEKTSRGERNGAAKLTWVQAEEIRRLYKYRVVLQRELAVRFNTTQSNVSRILRGVLWKQP